MDEKFEVIRKQIDENIHNERIKDEQRLNEGSIPSSPIIKPPVSLGDVSTDNRKSQ